MMSFSFLLTEEEKKAKAAKALMKQQKKDTLKSQILALQTTHPEQAAAVSLIEKDFAKATKTKELEAIETRLTNLNGLITKNKEAAAAAKLQEEKQNEDKRIASEKALKDKKDKEERELLAKQAEAQRLEEEKRQSIEKAQLADIKTRLSAQCAYLFVNSFPELLPAELSTRDLTELKAETEHVPDAESTLIEDDRNSFYALALEYEGKRRSTLRTIANMASSLEEKGIEEAVSRFSAEAIALFDRLKDLYLKISTKKIYSTSFIADQEQWVPGLYTPPTQLYRRNHITPENDTLAIDSSGHYTNGNHLQLDDEKNAVFTQPRDQELLNLYNDTKVMRQRLMTQITALHPAFPADDRNLAQIRQDMNADFTLLNNNYKEIATKVKARKDYIASRESLKDRLHLDMRNIGHVRSWARENNVCFHGWGGYNITVRNEEGVEEHLRVPGRIYQMMQVIDQDYLDAETFEAEFNAARGARPGWFSNPLSFWTRNSLTEMVYSEREIKTLEPFRPAL